MPKQKDLKRLVRARMQKTGESYTTARLHLVKPITEKPDYAKLAGMSDEKVKAATGCTWERWVKSLDYHKAAEMSHRDLARFIHQKYKTPSWWTQMVAVGYERIRGLRERGSRRGGDWHVSKSKTINVPMATLFAAFHDAKKRAKWLDAPLKVSTSTPEKSMRARWEDGTPVDIGFYARGAKSQVALQHRKLATKADADRMRAYWSARLDVLASLLTA